MRPIPRELHGKAFTRNQAERIGVSRRMLQGRRFVMIHPGIYRSADTEPTLRLLIDAALLVLPKDATVSHLTNLRLRGLDIGPLLPLHFSTNARDEIDRRGLVVHRRQGRLSPHLVNGVPALGPRRTFVDAATRLNDRNLLRVGDWLVRTAQVDLRALRVFVEESHLNGVQRARRVGRSSAKVSNHHGNPMSDGRWCGRTCRHRRSTSTSSTTTVAGWLAATSSIAPGRFWSSTTGGTTNATRYNASVTICGEKPWRPRDGASS